MLLVYWRQVRWHSPSRLSSPQIYLNLIIIAVIISNSLYLIFQLFLKHPFKNFLFLAYPYDRCSLSLSFSPSFSFFLLHPPHNDQAHVVCDVLRDRVERKEEEARGQALEAVLLWKVCSSPSPLLFVLSSLF
jgi:hypothetical protein